MQLEDVQAQQDDRGIGIDEVGISRLTYPVAVFDPEQGKQNTVATVSLSVALAPDQRGSHLSRFVEVFDDHACELTPVTIPGLLGALQNRLGNSAARLRISFPFFARRRAPVSGAGAMAHYACGFDASVREDTYRLELTTRVPVTSVCPCSKAVSDYGAHNQRGYVTIDVVPRVDGEREVVPLWFGDLIEVAESSASSPVFPILKRVDERHVTMQGYDNPVFVEDIVRGVTERLRDDTRVECFSVEAENEESIHDHAAFARLTWHQGSPQNPGPWLK
jgi:GTP cyclohydrolase IB